MTLRSSLSLMIATALVLPSITFAQSGPGFSQLDVRPPDAAANLNASLTRLGENPRDISALIGAGEAALDLDDPRAATGFFARADEIESGNGRIKAGLGRAMLQLQNAPEALRLFDQAERLRYPTDSYVGDRALARDLAGDQAGAQRDYQTALRFKPDDPELVRRYAVSLGISGQVAASEKLIEPLLYKNDRAAWRNRAFVLAMNGQQQQARDITQKVMPKPLADAIQPYMDRMAGLTPAQRAAAVHFGTFPSSAGVRIASNSVPPSVVPKPTPVPSASTPAQVQPRSTLVPKPSLVPTLSPAPSPRVDVATASHVPTGPRLTRYSTPLESKTVQGPIDPTPTRPSQPTFATQSAPAPIPTPQPDPNPVATRTLADIMRELDVPESETRSQVAAVDLSEIMALQTQKREASRTAADKAKRDAATKAKAETDAKAKALAAEKAKLAKNPSRNWVQIGTGQNVSALGFTLRGLRKKHDSIAAKDAFTAAWGRTNRLIVGPFNTFAKAKDFEATLKKAGADVFAWKSDAGEEVDPVSAQ